MIKALKPFVFGLLLHLYMQINILIQIKAYDSAPGFFSDMLAFILPIIFGFVVYCKLKNVTKVNFGITLLWFVALFVFFLVLGYVTDYFNWLFNLVVFYDETYYELDINAMLDGLLHTISIVVVFVTYIVKLKKAK